MTSRTKSTRISADKEIANQCCTSRTCMYYAVGQKWPIQAF